jgi:glycosyltransferase involved in cell wall biosynthesis
VADPVARSRPDAPSPSIEEPWLRILIAHSFYRVPGGEDRYVREQVGLLEADHNVELLSRRNDSLRPSVGTAAAMTFSITQVREVENAIDRFRPDVIHLHNPYPALGPAVHIAAERRRIPLMQTIHNFRLRCPNGFMYTEGQVCRRCERGNYVNATMHHCFPSLVQAGGYAASLWVHRFVLKAERKVSLFVAPSEFMQNRLIDWGIPSDRTNLLRNFVDVSPDASDEPGRYGAFVGRLSAEKGVAFLLQALRMAGDPPFRIVGDGPAEDDLKEHAARLRLDNTTFTGRLDAGSVRVLLRGARFLVMPSLWQENAPLAVLEAMAEGRPVLLSRRGGLPELAAGGGGLDFDPRDGEELAECMRLLNRDDSLCRRLGAEALNVSREAFSREGHRAGLESLYEEVVDRRSHP